jgi:hypothetical protein
MFKFLKDSRYNWSLDDGLFLVVLYWLVVDERLVDLFVELFQLLDEDFFDEVDHDDQVSNLVQENIHKFCCSAK